MNNIRPGYADEYGNVRPLDYGELLQLARETQAEVGAMAPKPHFRLRSKTASLPVVRIASTTPVTMGTLEPVVVHIGREINSLRARLAALEAERH